MLVELVSGLEVPVDAGVLSVMGVVEEVVSLPLVVANATVTR